MWDVLIRLAGKIAALLALIFSVRRAREKELRAEAAEHAAKVKDAQIDAAMDPARSRDDLVERLRKHGL